ncbi:hypothetical protein E2562_018045 [Oryza meyeriana var. granulata]|uniref:Uncharacterized protein n=1 Tax=Oryza meyeriana var. granulata TaxID=110450 RepID=A0A6G1C8Q7_9ORYZ|nr:hypothetical protein E2562_018045 [Oryza meyeriana var. granulata]
MAEIQQMAPRLVNKALATGKTNNPSDQRLHFLNPYHVGPTEPMQPSYPNPNLEDEICLRG